MPTFNPFNYGTSVEPNKYIGRESEIRRVVDELLNPSGQSFAVIGGKRCGKSSFLEAVQSGLIAQLPASPNERRYVMPLMVNLKLLSQASQETVVYGLILRLLYGQLVSKREHARLGIHLPLDPAETALEAFAKSGREMCMLGEFVQILEGVLDRFSETNALLRIVLLIDEIDTLIDRDWAIALFANMRSLIDQGSIRQDLRYVLAGSSRVIDRKESGSRFLNLLGSVYLHSLSDEAVNTIIGWAGDVSEEIKQAVRKLCGGHPYLVQYIMKNLWDANISMATTEAVDAQARRFMVEQRADLLTWMADVGQSGQSAYVVLAKADGWLTLEEVMHRLPQPSDANPGLTRLCYHGLAIQKDTYQRYRCSGDLFKTWFLQSSSLVVSGELPPKTRTSRHNDLRSLLEQKTREYEALPTERRTEGERMEIEQLRRELGLPAQLVAKPALHVMKLQLSLLPDNRLRVTGLAVPGGGIPQVESDLPFSHEHINVINRALDLGKFSEPETQVLMAHGLLLDGKLHSDIHTIVGQRLYDSLFTGEIAAELKYARRTGVPIGCQLYFDPRDVVLSQYPWELICDEELPLTAVRDGLELTRSILFASPPTILQASLPLKVLIISPRPGDPRGGVSLPNSGEIDALLTGLTPLQDAGKVLCTQLRPPTWKELREHLDKDVCHVIHFDGHGSFAKICPNHKCETANVHWRESCYKCGQDMSAIEPRGYLDFQGEDRALDRVSVNDLCAVVANTNTRLAVLSACNSGVTSETSIFSGIGPALIRAGIPAVIAMQGSPQVEASIEFFKEFYSKLARGKRITEAVNSGRLSILRNKPLMWFMPVVYLRSSDDTYGQLFQF